MYVVTVTVELDNSLFHQIAAEEFQPQCSKLGMKHILDWSEFIVNLVLRSK